MEKLQIVIDTNVLVAALRSRRGASYRLLLGIDGGKFDINLSVPLVLEYEQVCLRLQNELNLSEGDVAELIDYLCTVGRKHSIFYLLAALFE